MWHALVLVVAFGVIFTAAAVTEALGLFVAVVPNTWLGLLSHDPKVLAAGAL